MGSGKQETERMSLSFLGFKVKPKTFQPIHIMTLANRKLAIPAMTKDFQVKTNKWMPIKNIKILSFVTHIHARGTAAHVASFKLISKEKNIIFSIPRYFYGWQTGVSIFPKVPIAIKANSVELQAACNYDNSPQNPHNPDPSKIVSYGQRHDTTEMCHFHLGYTVDGEYF
jgi:hypothetical protein